MANRDFNRILIEGAVSRTMSQLRKDPRRSLRNLVDLGVTFSRGRFQKPFLEMAQTMLENQESAYYDLLELLAGQVDPEHIKTFGINLGYEGLTKGAATIRKMERLEGCNIPWVISLAWGGGMDQAAISHLIHQGMEQGVFVYGLLGDQVPLVTVQELTERFPRCAFFLMTTGRNILAQPLEPLRACDNLYISVETGEEAMGACEALAGEELFYGVHQTYGDEGCISPERLESYMDYRPVAVLLLPEDDGAYRLSQSIHQQVKALRMSQKYPFVLAETLGDSLYIDQVISGEGCILNILENGDARGIGREGLWQGGNILDMPLTQILRQYTPKAEGGA